MAERRTAAVYGEQANQGDMEIERRLGRIRSSPAS
jgi:hypothetical protein